MTREKKKKRISTNLFAFYRRWLRHDQMLIAIFVVVVVAIIVRAIALARACACIESLNAINTLDAITFEMNILTMRIVNHDGK